MSRKQENASSTYLLIHVAYYALVRAKVPVLMQHESETLYISVISIKITYVLSR